MAWVELGVALAPLIIWEFIWKGIGCWKAGRNNQPVWFLLIFILQTVGILPIVYLLFFQRRRKRIKRHANY